MKRFRHGLVVGYFSPFHAGHRHLVSSAIAASDRVTVVVVSRPDEPVPVEVRLGWIREVHPDVRVIACDLPPTPDTRDEDWRHRAGARVRAAVGEPVAAIFTGEDYGAPFAEVLDAQWVAVDPGRRFTSVSGSAVRAAPDRYWSLLPPPVRTWYVQRVVVLGAEATGSGTLAGALARGLGCGLVPDASRAYADERPRGATTAWASAEFDEVRRRQDDLERAGARSTPLRWLVANADRLTLDLWQLRCTGERPPAGAPAYPSEGPVRLYVLAGDEIDVPGGPHGGAGPRRAMQELLRRELDAQPVPWLEARGSVAQRVAQVLRALPETRFGLVHVGPGWSSAGGVEHPEE